MGAGELRSDVSGELEQLRLVVNELSSLRRDVSGRTPTLREKVAAAGFLSQFYNGIENILVRISKYLGFPLPEGEGWHVHLFSRFCGGSEASDEPGRASPTSSSADVP